MPLRQNTEKEGDRSGVGHLERMKRGSGIKDRDDNSIGIKILMSVSFVKINQIDPLRLTKEEARRNRN